MTDYEITSLRKRLELKAGFLTGKERFSLVVRKDKDTSSWNHKRLRITIGLAGMEKNAVRLGDLLVQHEVGHVLHTSRRIVPEALTFPFSLLNILEDARIEPKMGADFAPLHSYSYEIHYLKEREDDSVFSNPFNIGVLLRWRKWAVETMTEKPEDLSQEEYKRFLLDWQETIDRSIKAETTETVRKYGEEFYGRWKDLFDRYDTGEAAVGSIEGSADDFAGEGDDSESDKDPERGDKDVDPGIKEIEEYFGEEWFQWDMPFILEQARILRSLLDLKTRHEREYCLSGRRFDPRRIENPPLSPFRRDLVSRKVLLMKSLLLVEDGSGSMKGSPFRNACHLSYILSLVFPVDIMITTNHSPKPIRVPVKQIDILRRYSAWGGSENYASLETIPSAYSFTLFQTDACVEKSDQEYVRDVLTKAAKVGAGYVGDQTQRLENVFPRNFYSEKLDQNIARMVALFLKRYFTRAIAA
jgi:hypothetical protein